MTDGPRCLAFVSTVFHGRDELLVRTAVQHSTGMTWPMITMMITCRHGALAGAGEGQLVKVISSPQNQFTTDNLWTTSRR